MNEVGRRVGGGNPAQAGRCTRRVHGILLLDKPSGPSSNQAMQQARRLFGAEKAGHAGNLDPLATGLLPICFGEATKLAGHLLAGDKAYAAEAELGVTTTTDDAAGDVLLRRPVPGLDAATLERALAPLRGRIRQVPPVYSALKQGGVPLYRRARRGEEVQAPVREVEVRRLECVDREGTRLRLHVECGSGTYVRSLVRDLGEALGCGAHLVALRRLWAGPFRTPQMHTLEALAERAADGGHAALDALLLPLGAGLAGLPQLVLDEDAALRLRQGQVIDWPGRVEFGVATDERGRVLALVEAAGGRLRVRRGFRELD